jgi:hypothetical protein
MSAHNGLLARLGYTPRLGLLLGVAMMVALAWGLDRWATHLDARTRATEQAQLEVSRLNRLVARGESASWVNQAKQASEQAITWEAQVIETRNAQALKVALMSTLTDKLIAAQVRGYNVVLTERNANTPSSPVGVAATPNTRERLLGGAAGFATGAAGATSPTGVSGAPSAESWREAGLIEITATLSGSFDPRTVYPLMADLDAWPVAKRYESIVVRTGRFELTVSVLARASAGDATPRTGGSR